VRDLESLIEPLNRGDPESPLRWTCKSVRKLAQESGRGGHRVSHRLVAELLHELGNSLQANAKTLEGASHPDRNAQFEHIRRRFLPSAHCLISPRNCLAPHHSRGRSLLQRHLRCGYFCVTSEELKKGTGGLGGRWSSWLQGITKSNS
jgi:hypothetical protein